MTECVIEGCDDNDGLICEFQSSVMRTANKTHICGECGRVIERGERYEYAIGKWDGDFCTEKTCADCLSLRNTFFCSWLYSDIWNEFHDWFNDWFLEDSPILYRIENLTPRARDKVLELVAELEEDDEE